MASLWIVFTYQGHALNLTIYKHAQTELSTQDGGTTYRGTHHEVVWILLLHSLV